MWHFATQKETNHYLGHSSQYPAFVFSLKYLNVKGENQSLPLHFSSIEMFNLRLRDSWNVSGPHPHQWSKGLELDVKNLFVNIKTILVYYFYIIWGTRLDFMFQFCLQLNVYLSFKFKTFHVLHRPTVQVFVTLLYYFVFVINIIIISCNLYCICNKYNKL